MGGRLREIASKGQLRLAYLRWAVVTVPFVLLLGLASARLAPVGSANPWFLRLAKPGYLPPEWVFPVALAIVFALMGLALAMVINARGSRARRSALLLFAAQMVPGLAWPPVFFGMHQVTAALALVVAAAVLGLLAVILFGRVRMGAALLLLPYLGWLGFAGALLYEIDRRNPDAASLVLARPADQMQIQ